MFEERLGAAKVARERRLPSTEGRRLRENNPSKKLSPEIKKTLNLLCYTKCKVNFPIEGKNWSGRNPIPKTKNQNNGKEKESSEEDFKETEVIEEEESVVFLLKKRPLTGALFLFFKAEYNRRDA